MKITIFAKRFIVDIWQDSEYTSDFEYASVLNIAGFWIYQGCQCARVLNMLLVLIMSEFWIYHSCKNCQGYTGFSEYAWIIPGYAWLYLIMSKFVWIAFDLHLSIVIICVKEPWTVFSKIKNLTFSIVAESIWFCFRLNIFTSKISNLLLHLGAEGDGERESWYNQPMIYSITILMMLF